MWNAWRTLGPETKKQRRQAQLAFVRHNQAKGLRIASYVMAPVIAASLIAWFVVPSVHADLEVQNILGALAVTIAAGILGQRWGRAYPRPK